MAGGRMHDDEIEIDADLVRRLIGEQFPQWADLPLTPVHSAGTDNTLYRLGDDLVARLPRIHWAGGNVEREHEWLPRLAPRLPLPIAVPLALGVPGAGYPWHWSVSPWLAGADAITTPPDDLAQVASDLAHFIAALRRIDPTGGPRCERGQPLATRDTATREALAQCRGLLDTEAALAVWEAATDAPAWDGPPVWLHGDLQPLNLLVWEGRLSAIIDWGGCMGIGDPAVDLTVAWHLLDADAREVFRAALAVDDAMWARGRGLALSVGLIALPYYKDSNPVLASIARRTIQEALADDQQGR